MQSADEDESPSIAHLIEESYRLERSGEVSAALKRARAALRQARASGAPEDIAAALACEAHCLVHLGHFRQAYTLAKEALTQTTPDSKTCADSLRILGGCAHEAGDLEAAEDFYHRAIDAARLTGDHPTLQSCLHSLSACVYIPRGQGQFELALAADEESLRLALEIGMEEIAWFPLLTLSWVNWVTGQRERALALVEKMSRFVQPGSMGEGYFLCLRADLALDSDDHAAIPDLYAHARAIAEIVGDPGLPCSRGCARGL